MNGLFFDTSKFRSISIKSGKERNYILQLEDRLTSFLESVKNSLFTNLYKELYRKGIEPGVMHDL